MVKINATNDENINRTVLPLCAKIAVGLQGLLICIAFFVWGAWTTWGRPPYSIEASSVMFGPQLILCAVATAGLWRGKMYGWVCSLLAAAVMSLTLGFTAGPTCILPLGIFIFLLSPKVRGFYVRNYYE